MTAPVALKYRPTGTARARLPRWNVVMAVAVVLAVVVVVANLVVSVVASGADTTACPARAQCAVRSEASKLTQKQWPSSDLAADTGFSFDYDTYWFDIVDQDRRSVLFTIRGRPGLDPQPTLSSASVWVASAPATDASPAQLLADRRRQLSQRMVGGLADDNHSASAILGPSLGYVKAIGGSYAGTLDSVDGPNAPARVAIIAAGDGRISVVFSYVIAGTHLDAGKNLSVIRGLADSMLSTFQWRR